MLEQLLAHRQHRWRFARRSILEAMAASAPRRGDVLVALIEALNDKTQCVREGANRLLRPILDR